MLLCSLNITGCNLQDGGCQRPMAARNTNHKVTSRAQLLLLELKRGELLIIIKASPLCPSYSQVHFNLHIDKDIEAACPSGSLSTILLVKEV